MKAWELIEREENWSKGAWTKNRQGQSVDTNSEDACQWCLQAAITKCYPIWRDYYPAVRRAAEVTGHHWLSLYVWNDAPGRTHAQVLAAMRKADV